MSKLYLIRHAQPLNDDYLTRNTDTGLGDKGRDQAKAIAHFLVQRDIEQLWSSTSQRAKQTVEPLLKEHPMHLGYCQALEEKRPELESDESLERRIQDWWKERRAGALKQNTAIFAHCGPLNSLIAYEDPNKEKLDYSFEDEKGCWTPIAGVWELRFDNSGTLLGGELQDYQEEA